jgi:RES domain
VKRIKRTRTGFRQTALGLPFLWESSQQPAARWHAQGDGPVQYFASSAEGAWAEWLRHEEIKNADELNDVVRVLWTADLGEAVLAQPELSRKVLLGDQYQACQQEAKRLQDSGEAGLETLSAALTHTLEYRTDNGMKSEEGEALVFVLFGVHPKLRASRVSEGGIPNILERVRQFQ